MSFYRSQHILGWSKFFGPDQKLIYITFCASPKHFVPHTVLSFNFIIWVPDYLQQRIKKKIASKQFSCFVTRTSHVFTNSDSKNLFQKIQLKKCRHNALLSLCKRKICALWRYMLWSFTFGDTKSNKLLTKNEVFQRILWYILKWNDSEPTKFWPIVTK